MSTMPERETMTVRDVMKTGYDLVEGTATVSEALQLMKHVETKCLIVKKRHDRDEYGIVVIADIARQVLSQNRSPERVSIYEVMTKPAVTVHPDMDIRYASRNNFMQTPFYTEARAFLQRPVAQALAAEGARVSVVARIRNNCRICSSRQFGAASAQGFEARCAGTAMSLRTSVISFPIGVWPRWFRSPRPQTILSGARSR